MEIGIVLSLRGHLAMLESFLFTTRGEGIVPLASSGQRTGMLVNILECRNAEDSPLQQRFLWSRMPLVRG